ncbi:MAG: GGDEF domain-containing protein [Nitrospiria bacterium]
MSDGPLHSLKLTEAIQLICQADYPDPRNGPGGDEKVLQRIIDSLCELSMHDGLTGLNNARYFQIALNREVHRAAREEKTCALLMVDIDLFKSINDTYGHLAGDNVIQTVASRMKENLRPVDTIARYGGEEFSIILPHCFLNYARQVAERLRKEICDFPIPVSDKTKVPVSVSIGIACTCPTDEANPGALIKAADQNLYKAKGNGRNQVWSEITEITEVSAAEKAALFHKTKQKRRKKITQSISKPLRSKVKIDSQP